MSPRADPARSAAFARLVRWHPLHHTLESLDSSLPAPASPRDAALAHHLAATAILRLQLLDHWIDHLTARGTPGRPTALEPPVRAALRLGLTQIRFSQVADHAAVATTVALVPLRARGLVNAVLRRALREPAALDALEAAAPPDAAYSLSPELWQKWVHDLGEGAARALAAHSLTPAPVFLAPNFFHPDAATLAKHPGLAPAPGHPGFLTHRGPVPSSWLEDGLVYIQDPASALAPRLLAPRPGETVADFCAAPGGKTRLLAELSHGQAILHAFDSHPDRLTRLEENLRRLRVPNTTSQLVDWTNPPHGLPCFDAILVDAPCSNTGVLRRRLEARHRFSRAALDQSVHLQATLLDHAARHLRPGGRLVYATCSLEPEENILQIGRFLARHPGWSLATTCSTRPPSADTDGHFAALLRPPA